MGSRTATVEARDWPVSAGVPTQQAQPPLPARLPDDNDPPELEYYRARPFHYHDRLAAAVLNYAPSPQAVNPRQMPNCTSKNTHGPQLGVEWWIYHPAGNKSWRPEAVSEWQRPYRPWDSGGREASPSGVMITHAPLWRHGKLLWYGANADASSDNSGSASSWFGLPEWRLGGLKAVANAVLTTQPLTLSPNASRLCLNAAASWPGQGMSDEPAGEAVAHCDPNYEHCQSYIMIEALDAATGATTAGYEPEKCIMQNVDGVRLPLVWSGGRDTRQLNGRSVQIRLHVRRAVVYALVYEPVLY